MTATFYFGVGGTPHDSRSDFDVSSEDAPRILMFLLESEYGKVTENVISTIPDPNWTPAEDQTEADRPTIEIQQWVTRQATPEEASRNFARAKFDELRSRAVEHQKQKAAAAAAAAVAPIAIVNP